MEKVQKKAKKNSRNKKSQPLKVVYITNPIKFKTSASEFRALVQELTGQDADSDTDAAYSSASTFSAEKVAAEEDNLQAEVTKLERPSGGDVVEQDWSGPSGAGLYDDNFVSSMMIESFQEWLKPI